jgi:preprotein translocase subunit SecE
MAQERSAVAPFLGELVSLEIYKRSQGRIARQATFGALWAVLGIGAWRLSEYWVQGGWVYHYLAPAVSRLLGHGGAVAEHWMVVDQYILPALVVAVGGWVAFRAVNMPRFADFLIAVEAEMNKVSWPTRAELFRSSVVVLITIFVLAAVLFAYDVFWRYLLRILGIVGGG